ncbi:MAG: patatin-like phospholipase family protein [Bacteroidales bacterium]|nr:patatin-like phospholipase family protein [Bacteroidales bacterium]MCF8338139.1 patatin-like phospholipase family protein [Bacteroidales bacterium]
MAKLRIGLTLSGGGARGIAHIGVLKALKDYGIVPDAISGTSMGALVGVMYADGKTPEEIMEFIKDHKLSGFFKWNIPKMGFIDSYKLYDVVNNYLKAKRFEDLQTEFHVSATNLNDGEYRIFSSGDLVKPVVASACIPVVFVPFEIDGDSYVDGGLLNNLPIEPLKDGCDKIIGVHVNRHGRKEKVKKMRGIADRSFRIAIWENVKPRLEECDFVIEPTGVYDYGVFDFSKADDLYHHGYLTTEQKILELFDYFNLDKIMEKKEQKKEDGK